MINEPIVVPLHVFNLFGFALSLTWAIQGKSKKHWKRKQFFPSNVVGFNECIHFFMH